MNIIKILDEQIQRWNAECKCGLCWKFKPSGRADYFNNIKVNAEEACCVYVGVLSIRNAIGYTTNANGLVDRRYIDWQLRMVAGIPSGLDLQFYNEDESYRKASGKWQKYISRIFECFGGCNSFEFCDIHNCTGSTVAEVVRWESEMVLNYKDVNLDGVLVNATIREWLN